MDIMQHTQQTSVHISEAEERNLIDGLNAQAWSETWKGNWPHLMTLALDALDRANRIDYMYGVAHAKLNLGQLHRLRSDVEKAETLLREAKNCFQRIDDEIGVGLTWHQLGQLNMHRGKFETAIEAFLESRDIWMRTGHESRLATSYVSIGSLYCALEQYDSGESQFEVALAIYKRLGDEVGYARVLSNYARVAQVRHDEPRALQLQLEAIEILERNGQAINIAATYLNLGSTYCRLKQFDQSIAVLTTALEVADQSNFKRAQFMGRLYLAETYYEVGDIATARKYFEESGQYNDGINLGDVAFMGVELNAKLHAAEGNYKRAYELHCESAVERNKTMSANTQHAVAIRSAHYQFEESLRKKQELRQQNIDLQALNDHKDEVLRIVSHDMRNPLGFIIGMGNLLKTEPADHIDTVHEIGGLIEETGQRLLGLVNNLLNAAKLAEGVHKLEKTATSIPSMLRESEKLFGPLARNKEIQLQIDTTSCDGMVHADEPKLQQVIGNLLSNALKFTPRGGRIDVTAVRQEKTFCITVHDTGIGMNEEQLTGLFTKFSSTRRSGTDGEKGIGLGMTIIRQFVDLHEGSISVHSTPGEGTTISVCIPEL